MSEWRAEDTKWGRCEATAKSHGGRCGRAATGDHGKCDRHGGKSLKGKDHPNYKHGAWSKYVDYDDEILDSVANVEDDLAVLEELRNERLGRYYTILNHLSENEGVEVARQILEQIDAGQEVDAQLVGQLARVMDVSSKSMDNLIARIQSLTNDIADRRGDFPRTTREEQDLSDDMKDRLDRLSENIEDAYGDE